MNQNIDDLFKNLDHWIEENPTGYDLLDIKNKPFYFNILKLSQKSKLHKIFTAPFIITAERHTNFWRKILKITKHTYPQAEALIARAYFAYYKKSQKEIYLQKAEKKLQWLRHNKSQNFEKYCWGQPYDWFSRKIIPAHTPRATVSTQVANAFMDGFEITNNKDYIEIAASTADFFIEDFNWNEDKDGDICFSYTTEDNYHIHNANMLISATLIRCWKLTGIDKFKYYGIKSMNFTLKHQNDDGSWFYWAPPDKIIGKIDNYHTGFVLEALEINRRCLGEEFKAKSKYQKGIDYYICELFDNKIIPRLTNKSTYPIDIQSCAQAITTFGELFDYNTDYLDIAKSVANWTNSNLLDKEGFYYYRMYRNGKIDKTPYIRWSESWMLRALIFLMP